MIASLFHLLMLPASIRLGWALVHFLWQGLMIAGLLEVALLIVGRKNASLRHLLCGAALSLMAACFVCTYFWQSPDASTTTTTASTRAPLVSPPNGKRAPSPLSLSAVEAFVSPPALPVSSFDLNRCMPWVVTLWLAGVVALAGRKAGGFFVVWRLRHRGTFAPEEALLERFRELCRKIGVDPHRISLKVSARVRTPMTMGWLRPIVLLPVTLLSGLTPDEIDLLLAHELAHIRRCDYLVNILQTVVETVFFYHPATWWISRRMRQERENACDDLIATKPDDVLAYAKVLVRLETTRPASSWLAVGANGGQLLQRVQRLAGKDRGPRSFVVSENLFLLVPLLLMGIWGGTLLGRSKAPEKQDYPVKANIETGVFWLGKTPFDDSIRNVPNPFYAALPFNDLRHPEAAKAWVPKSWIRPVGKNGPAGSACLNRWIKITNKKGISCYAQWEDFGPGTDNDPAYVFGKRRPLFAHGLDISPAVSQFLKVTDYKPLVLSWQFVDDADVPAGPWLTMTQAEAKAKGVAALVNHTPILGSEVDAQAAATVKTLSQNFSGDELRRRIAEAKINVLGALIDRRVILDYFASQGGSIPPAFIDGRVNDVVKNGYGGDRNTFLQTLKARGISLDEFRREIADNATVQYMRARNVNQPIARYYQENLKLFPEDDRINVTIIGLQSSKPAQSGNADGKTDNDPSSTLAQQILKKVRAGADFNAFAKKYHYSTDQEGIPYWVTNDGPSVLPSWLPFKWPDVEKMQPGQTTGVMAFPTDDPDNHYRGYFILKVNDRRPASIPSTAATTQRRQTLINEETQRVQKKWLKDLRAKAVIQRFDDPKSSDLPIYVPKAKGVDFDDS